MAYRVTLDPHPSTYPSPTLSPAVSLPSLSGSLLLDCDGPMPETPGAPEPDSTTGLEPLGASQSLEGQKDSLQLATSPRLEAEGQEAHTQGEGSTTGTAAATGLFYPSREPEQGSAYTTDEEEHDSFDPYDTAFMELDSLRLSSRRLLMAVLELAKSEHLETTRDITLDDRLALDIFDVHVNLEAATNVVSVITGYKSVRFRREESSGRTRDHHPLPDETGRFGTDGALLGEDSSQVEASEPCVGETPLPTVDINTSAESLTATTRLQLEVNDGESTPQTDTGPHRTLRRAWRAVLNCRGGLGDAFFHDQFNMILLFLITEILTQMVMIIYRAWTTYVFWWPEEPQYQCWEAV